MSWILPGGSPVNIATLSTPLAVDGTWAECALFLKYSATSFGADYEVSAANRYFGRIVVQSTEIRFDWLDASNSPHTLTHTVSTSADQDREIFAKVELASDTLRMWVDGVEVTPQSITGNAGFHTLPTQPTTLSASAVSGREKSYKSVAFWSDGSFDDADPAAYSGSLSALTSPPDLGFNELYGDGSSFVNEWNSSIGTNTFAQTAGPVDTDNFPYATVSPGVPGLALSTELAKNGNDNASAANTNLVSKTFTASFSVEGVAVPGAPATIATDASGYFSDIALSVDVDDVVDIVLTHPDFGYDIVVSYVAENVSV